MRWKIPLSVFLCCVGVLFAQDEKTRLNVALLNPVTTLNPYYNDGIEAESIINILFDSVYVEGETGTKASFAKLIEGTSPSSLQRPLEVEDRYVRWMPEYRDFVNPEDARFTFYYLNSNKASNNTYTANYIRGFKTLSEEKFEVLLRTPPDTKTLKQQLDFKILPARFAREHISIFNTKSKAFEDSKSFRHAMDILKGDTGKYLKVKDLLVKWEDGGYFNERGPGTYRILLETTRFDRFKGTIFRNLNLGEVAYSFYVYKNLFPELGGDIKVLDIEPLNNGLAASVFLDSNTAIADSGLKKFVEMPLLFRQTDPSMKNVNRFWGSPQTSYKFSIQERANDFIALKREKSRVKGKDRSEFSVQTVHFTRQAGNDIASIRSGFQSGAIDMIMNISPSLSKHITSETVDKLYTKGSQIEMIALNCTPYIDDKENPLADYRVRLALNYILVKEDLHVGHGPENSNLMHSPLTSADTRDKMKQLKLSNQKEKAAELLTQAGFSKKGDKWVGKNGKPLLLKLIFEKVLDSRDRNLLVEVVNQFRTFGIQVTDPHSSSLGRIDFYQELKHNKTWHLALVRVFQSSNTDIDMYNPDSPSKNIYNYEPSETHSAKLRELFKTYQTSRDEQRRNIKQEIATMITEEAPALFLWDFQAIYMANANTLLIQNNNSPSTFNVLQHIDDFRLTK
ncbi:SBP-bac-5 domain-containing protein [Sulfidibacter corallicola]|uniref:Solute-binding protein family 5 domain-containing protein n=1 Tax=Sulfidibacter corallicola TaxID=2818388 RepID=A0A8A4TX16_SULCO|nr:ABC transporter substrate-binding protein [Sulfidibacter corallicola]QTD54020.1 hypothetical protein J3U87_16360 [Sulfidibacter corallicola]